MRRFHSILVVVTGRPGDRVALHRAVTLAGRNQATVRVLDVEPVPGRRILSRPRGDDLLADLLADRHDELAEWLDDEVGADHSIDVDVTSHARPHVAIIEAVLLGGHDLVVLAGTSVRSSEGLSSVTLHVLRKCPVPVWVIRGSETSRHVASAVSLDEQAPGVDALDLALLQMGATLATDERARFSAVHVWNLPGESLLRSARRGVAPAVIEELRDEERRGAELRLELAWDAVADDRPDGHHHLLHGRVDERLVHFVTSHDVDTLVLGMVGRGGLPGVFMGNTAEEVLLHVRCSVLAVKPPGFVTPVVVPSPGDIDSGRRTPS